MIHYYINVNNYQIKKEADHLTEKKAASKRERRFKTLKLHRFTQAMGQGNVFLEGLFCLLQLHDGEEQCPPFPLLLTKNPPAVETYDYIRGGFVDSFSGRKERPDQSNSL